MTSFHVGFPFAVVHAAARGELQHEDFGQPDVQDLVERRLRRKHLRLRFQPATSGYQYRKTVFSCHNSLFHDKLLRQPFTKLCKLGQIGSIVLHRHCALTLLYVVVEVVFVCYAGCISCWTSTLVLTLEQSEPQGEFSHYLCIVAFESL